MYFSRDGGDLLDPKLVSGTDIFVETNQSAKQITRFCRCLLAAFGYSEDDLKIELREE